jgi:hypothetical protein
MKPTDQIIEGLWWINGDANPAVPGVLHYGDRLRLSIHVPQDPQTNGANLAAMAGNARPQCSPVIHGQDANGKPVTLFGCYVGNSNWSLAQIRLQISAMSGIRGLALGSWAEPAIRVLSIKVEHLARWCSWNLYQMGPRKNGEPITFTIDQPRDVVCPVSPGVEFRVERGAFINQSHDGLKVDALGHIHFRFDEPRSLQELREKWLPWASQLMSLLFGTTVRILEIEIFSRDRFAHVEDVRECLGKDAVFLDRTPEPKNVRISNPDHYNMVAPYPEIASRFPEIVVAWDRCRESLSPVVGFFSAVALHHALYDKAQFMFLVQALEIYHSSSGKFVSTELPKEERDARLKRAMDALPADLHEWARGKLVQNNKSMSKKLLDIFNAHAVDATAMLGDISQAADRIGYTRNNFTHHMESVNHKRLLSDNEISQVAWALEALLWIILLRELGIDGQPVQRLLQRVKSTTFVSIHA